MIEPEIKPIEGAARLARGFFNSLIRRIECTKPLAGEGISISAKPNGIELSLKPSNAITITVCSAGEVKRLVLFYDEKRSKQATVSAGLTWP